MPELPEVETVRLGLKPVLEGRILVRVVQRRTGLRIPFPDGFVKSIEGHRVISTARRGKYLLFNMDNDLVLIVHLGMSGRFCIFRQSAPPPGKHDHVIFETDQGVSIYFHDPRRFGLMTLANAGNIDQHRLLGDMGMEPFNRQMNGSYLLERFKGRKRPVKTMLLDQKIIAGIGNIYASEILFRAGISPERQAASIKKPQAAHLAEAIRTVLDEAIEAGGTTLRDHLAPDGEPGYFQQRLSVYGRETKPCPNCDCNLPKTGGIKRIIQSGRSTFYCAKKQK